MLLNANPFSFNIQSNFVFEPFYPLLPFTELQSNFFIENHSHMLSGNHDNETTLRLLYYPPVIQEDDNKCEMAKGRCKYSQQRCNGDNSTDLVPPRYVKDDKSDKDEEEDDG